MKKLLLVLLAVLAATSMSFAQKGQMTIGGLAGLYVPMGDFGDAAGTGFGILPQFEYKMNENVNLVGNIGYVSWGGKTIDMPYYDYYTGTYGTQEWEYSYHNIPIMAGAKYYFGNGKLKTYGMANLSMNMFGFTVEFMGESESESETYFGFGFGGGFEKPLNEKMNLDVAAAFESIASEGSSANSLVIKAGIKYFLK